MNKKPLGSPVRASFERNCLQCSKWIVCRNPEKNFDFACSKFNKEFELSAKLQFEEEQDEARTVTKDRSGLLLPNNLQVIGSDAYNSNIQIQDEDDDPAFELSNIIKKVLRSGVPVPPDLRIDDNDIARPRNIIDWMTDARFVGGEEKPFGKQIQVASHYMAEWCVAKGTFIYTNKGLIPVEDLSDSLLGDVTGFKTLTKDGIATVSRAGKTSNKKQKCLKFIAGGRELIVTPEHRMYVLRNGWEFKWVYAKDVVPSTDYFVMPHKVGLFPKNWPVLPKVSAKTIASAHLGIRTDFSYSIPKVGTLELCKLAGYLASDGNIGINRFGFINTHKELVDDFENCVSTITDFKPSKVSYIATPHTAKVIHETSYNRSFLARVLNGIGIHPGIDKAKTVPEFVLKSPKEGVIAYIKAVLECDGCVSPRSVRLKMASEDVVTKIDLMMQNLGIYGNLHRPVNNGKTPKWRWVCHDSEALKKFFDVFGEFYSIRPGKEKEVALSSRTCSRNKPGVMVNADLVQQKISNLTLPYHTKRQVFRKGVGTFVYRNWDYSLVTNKLKELGLHNEVKVIRESDENKYAFCKVESVTDAGLHYVYDLTVPKGENFLANGIVVHNCPKCSDEDYFENVPVKHREDRIRERVVFLHNGKCPKCKRNKVELIEDYELMDPFEFVGVVGQRGSKTITATLIKSYNCMQWLTTPNLPATYGILPSTILTGTVTATTFNQAKENFWAPFDSLISTSAWFKEYHGFLRDVGMRYGEELVKHSETMIAYKHKNLFFSPASPSQRSLRGRTRNWATVDEGGWFKSATTKAGETAERMNGPEVYTALKRSLTTIRSAYLRRRNAGYFNLPKPLMTLISSPSARNDLIMTRYREAQGSREVYSIKCPTWEFNPLIKRKDLDEEFRVRPIESLRDYGCEPPMAMNAWIGDEQLVENSFGDRRNCVTTTTRRIRTKSRKLATAAEYKTRRTANYEYGGVMAIDAGWNCLAGDTLIPTEYGLRRIDSLGDKNGNKIQDVNIKVQGYEKAVKVVKWIKSGKKRVYEIKTSSGHTLPATKNHPILVLRNGEHVWVKTNDIIIGDNVCLPSTGISNTKKLSLNLSLDHDYRSIAIKQPKIMTPELAYFIGGIVSEGSISKYCVRFTNSDINYYNKIKDCAYESFGFLPVEIHKSINEKEFIIKGRITKSTKEKSIQAYPSVIMSKWLRELGLFYQNGIGHQNSYNKVIPWAILEADSTSQAAFLASYIEGDGSIRLGSSTISVWSRSRQLLQQMQILFNKFGVMSRLSKYSLHTSSAVDAEKLYNIIEPHLVSKKNLLRSNRISYKNGFDASYFNNVIASRYVRRDRWGSVYVNDQGKEVLVKGRINFTTTRFTYDSYLRGNYEEYLGKIKLISKELHQKLINTFKLRYNYSAVAAISERGVEEVYDLTVEHGQKPAFVANGIVVHNCNSFAIAIGYPTSVPDVEDDDDEDIFVGMEIGVLVEIIPRKTHPISFTRVYNDVIKPMCEEFNVACVVSDRWQNKKIVQDIEDALGLEYFELKAGIGDYDDYKQCLYDEMITHPKLDMDFEQISNMTLDNYPECFQKTPAAHLAFQMLTVQNSGTAVVKGEDGTTDDLLRTCILAHMALQDEEILEICLEHTNSASPQRSGIAAIATGTGRATSISNIANFGVMLSRSNFSGGGTSAMSSIGGRVTRK